MVRSKICSSNLRRSAALLPNFSSSADNWHRASSLTLPSLLAFSTSSRATARLLVTDDLWPLRTCHVFLSFELSSSVSTIESVTDEPFRQRRAPTVPVLHTKWSNVVYSEYSMASNAMTRIQTIFSFLSGNLTPLFLRLQYILNVFKFRSFVTSLSLSIAQKLKPENVLGVSILPRILSKRDET